MTRSLFVIYSEGAQTSQSIGYSPPVRKLNKPVLHARKIGSMTANQTSGYDPQKIEKRMDALAREFTKTRDPEIREEFINWLGG
jgi:hypothetical protein